jgi:hypothetical protein
MVSWGEHDAFFAMSEYGNVVYRLDAKGGEGEWPIWKETVEEWRGEKGFLWSELAVSLSARYCHISDRICSSLTGGTVLEYGPNDDRSVYSHPRRWHVGWLHRPSQRRSAFLFCCELFSFERFAIEIESRAKPTHQWLPHANE